MNIYSMLNAGWALVPIPTGMKGPIHPGWNERKNAITDIKDAIHITENVGLAHAYCTQPTAVLDIDNLERARVWLSDRGVDLDALLSAEDAVQIVSGRPNRAKLLYRLPPSSAPLQTKKITSPEDGRTILEFRCASKNGKTVQDVLPPSIHPETGEPYQWGGRGTPKFLPVIPMALFFAWPKESSQVSGVLASGGDVTQTLVDDSTIQHLRSALLSMRSDDRELWVKCGLALKDLEECGRGLWLEWSATSEKFDPGDSARVWDSLSPTDISYKFIFSEAQRRGWTNPAKKLASSPADNAGADEWPTPLTLPPSLRNVRPIDPESLPSKIRFGIQDIAERLNCPLEYVAIPVLIAAGVAVGNRIGIRPKQFDDSWKVFPTFWGGIIGPPGSLKTPAQTEALKSLRDLESQAGEKYASALDQYNRDKRLYDRQIKEFEKGRASWPQEPPRPPKIRYVVNDVTYQALGVILADNPSGVLAYADELSGLLQSLDSPGQEGARGFFLAGWGGQGNHTFDRITRGSIVLNNYTLSLFGGFQPDRVRQYVIGATNGSSTNDGLMQRFQLLVWPDQPEQTRVVDRPRNKSAVDEMHKCIRTLKRLSEKASISSGTQSRGALLHQFDSAAQHIFDCWYHQNEEFIRNSALSASEQSHFAKYRSLVPGLALLFHLIEEHSGPVCADCILNAIHLARALKSHAHRTYASIFSLDLEPARELGRRIVSGDLQTGFTARSVYSRHWRGLNRGQVISALEQLVDFHWLKETVIQTSGRQKIEYEINPKVHAGVL